MIYVLTYNDIHRKTYDTLNLLKASGYNDVTVIATPYHYEKKFQPLIKHRPEAYAKATPEQICNAHNYSFKYIDKMTEIDGIIAENKAKVLICGAGIIPQEIINNYIFINSHPGVLPNVRGLDALKWAIIEGQPIGVTSHVITGEADSGFLIEQKYLELYRYDTFHAIAQRQYELEIYMLVNALKVIDNCKLEKIDVSGFSVHKRMPHEYESLLFECLNKRIKDISI